MNGTDSFSLLLLAAILVGGGLYLIQRSRYLVPILIRRYPYLQQRPHVARRLLMFLLTVGILLAGMGCRLLVNMATG